MQRRGDDLRDRILSAAKDVFLAHGFDRASMDLIAEKADTTKRTLYAHFESKEKLFLAIVDYTRGLLAARLKFPADYGDDPDHALVLFCGRFLETMIWNRSIRMCRLTLAEAGRFPDGAALFHEAIFGTVQDRLATYLRERLAVPKSTATRAAVDLLGRILYPRFTRALFGAEPEVELHDDAAQPSEHVDLKPIRAAVAETLRAARAR
ncbi:MAG TPA: TetR/AcrR family transcriptional regulator [Kofleriaceae bacterium]